MIQSFIIRLALFQFWKNNISIFATMQLTKRCFVYFCEIDVGHVFPWIYHTPQKKNSWTVRDPIWILLLYLSLAHWLRRSTKLIDGRLTQINFFSLSLYCFAYAFYNLHTVFFFFILCIWREVVYSEREKKNNFETDQNANFKFVAWNVFFSSQW